MKIFKAADNKSLPWKNGLGTTNEIAISPAGADFTQGDFHFRISRASIDLDSDFSRFENYDRDLIIIDGPGLRIARSNDTSVVLGQFVPFHFRGEERLRGELVDGQRVKDLNVFCRRGRLKSEIEIITLEEDEVYQREPSAHMTYAFVGAGSCETLDLFDAALVSEFATFRAGDDGATLVFITLKL